MLAGNAYATTIAAATIPCSRTLWMQRAASGKAQPNGGKGRFRNDPLALHHTEAIIPWTLRESGASRE